MLNQLEKVLNNLTRNSFTILLIGLLLAIVLAGFLYWQYLYLPLTLQLEEISINKPDAKTLKEIIETLEDKEIYYLENLNKEYQDPFF